MAAERLTFLFWNVQRKPLEEPLRRLIAQHDIDVLLLAEANVGLPSDLGPLTRSVSICDRIAVYARVDAPPVRESVRWTIRRLDTPHGEVLLTATHLPSAMHFSTDSRNMEAMHLARVVRDVEGERRHTRTLVVGDLNLDPFAPGIVGAEGFHAVSSRDIATEGSRTVQGREYPFFYNPMWSHLGDRLSPAAGTYFYRSAEPVCLFWHAFDQVLLRPALLPLWHPEALRVLAESDGITFVDAQGRPDASRFSDHLPLLFRLDL